MAQPRLKAISDAERGCGELPDSASDAILELDRDGHITVLNRAAELRFGYTREEMMRLTINTLVPEAARATPTRRCTARCKDGTTFPVEITRSSVSSGTRFRVTSIIRDITGRTQMEGRSRASEGEYIRELELRYRETEQADRLKTEFLGNISHELRSPLHTVMGFTQLLAEEKDGPLNEKQKRFIRHIQSDSLHLRDLINDLLDLHKIEAGHLRLRCEVFAMDAVIAEAIASVQLRVREKSLAIETDISISTAVCADRMRVKQILHNLLTNAIEFTPGGGGVRIQARGRGRFVEISVSDTGIGIPEDQQRTVFDKFHQVRAVMRSGGEGTGLGLAITKHLVEQHGGSISITSRVGCGSCFVFTIPFEQPL